MITGNRASRFIGKVNFPPHDTTPAHRAWTKAADDLDLTLASHEGQVLPKSLISSYWGTKLYVKGGRSERSMLAARCWCIGPVTRPLRFSYKERWLICAAYWTYAMRDQAEEGKTFVGRLGAITASRPTASGSVTLGTN